MERSEAGVARSALGFVMVEREENADELASVVLGLPLPSIPFPLAASWSRELSVVAPMAFPGPAPCPVSRGMLA